MSPESMSLTPIYYNLIPGVNSNSDYVGSAQAEFRNNDCSYWQRVLTEVPLRPQWPTSTPPTNIWLKQNQWPMFVSTLHRVPPHWHMPVCSHSKSEKRTSKKRYQLLHRFGHNLSPAYSHWYCMTPPTSGNKYVQEEGEGASQLTIQFNGASKTHPRLLHSSPIRKYGGGDEWRKEGGIFKILGHPHQPL